MTLTIKTESDVRKHLESINGLPAVATFLSDVKITDKDIPEDTLELPSGTSVRVNRATVSDEGLEIAFDSYRDGSSVFDNDSEASATVAFGSFELEITVS